MVAIVVRLLKRLRIAVLRATVWRRYDICSDFHAGRGVVLWAKSHLRIGANVYIGRYSQIECDADIGDDVIMGNSVAFVGKYDHRFDDVGVPIRESSEMRDPDYAWKGLGLRVAVGDDAWIGYGSIVLSGVAIGEGAIVAAGSVVTKNVAPCTIVGGNPARPIGMRFPDEAAMTAHRAALAVRRERRRQHRISTQQITS
jgi:acetyltransferase-like isoleucine patch superfamily enzyme